MFSVIVFSCSCVSASQRFNIFLSNTRHCLDTDQVVHTRFGEARYMMSLLHHQGRAHGLVGTSTMPGGDSEVYLVETRELIDGGMAHIQVSTTTSSL